MSTVNMDPSEIEKFSALAAQWWDRSGEFKSLHDINPLRLNWIDEQCGGLAGKTVIDVGCGGGILAESMAQKGASVTGIDLAQKSLSVAKLHGLESGVKVNYQHIAAEDMAATNPNHFDVVTCMEMLEHVPQPASIIQACAEMVKPGGHVLFSTLNRTLKSYLLAIVGAEYIAGIVPKGTHEHKKFIQPGELANMAVKAGLRLVRFKGLEFNPLHPGGYHLTNNTDVNYFLACVKDV